jgi:6-phosphogluconolactonase
MWGKINYFSTDKEMYSEAAKLIYTKAQEAVARFSFALSGGETPLPLYRELASLRDFPWAKIDFFWGDERCVKPADKRSNYTNAMDYFLREAPILEERIHRIKTELAPAQAARDYEKELLRFKKANKREKLFDLVLLGMGEDGHTASLFPGSSALNERKKLVVPVSAPENVQVAVPRITLTCPAIMDSEMVLFMIKGKKKKDLLLKGRNLPALMLDSKKTIWFVTERQLALT